MTLFLILLALMAAATVIDGWSQHKMLKVNGGKGYETSKIYGQNPSYLRYALVNVPVLVGAAGFMWYGATHFFPFYPIFGAAFVAWHGYGVYLNQKNF